MKKWRFVSNLNSTIVGINDAGIETFTANMSISLVREMIQNALDAILQGSTSPVRVDFSCFQFPTTSIPDVDAFKAILSKCKSSNQNEPDAYKFFETAENILSQPFVSVLRVSDHNTTGLEGADTCAKGTAWSRLVKESGSSNKGQGSGGSFGIGKAAAFACSDLRMVFYSSKDCLGNQSNFGVAKLVSFEDGTSGWTTGTGYYSEDERFVAIPELADLDPNYVRNDPGTDIYIFGMHRSDDFKKEFIRAVLSNFLVSIIHKKLVVSIQGEVIDDKTLPAYMAKLNPYDGDEIKALLDYYRTLTSPDPRIKKIVLDPNVYGKKYGFKAGECTLYLMEGEGLNRKIMVTRRAGMRILEQNRISGSIEFTGVLVIDGDNMNEAFKKMEVPSHDAWEPGRCRGEEKYYNSILSDLKKYLRDTVKECFGKVDSVAMDAFGASDFLPDEKEEDKEKKLQKDEMSTRISSLTERIVQPSNQRTKAFELTQIELDPDQEGGAGPNRRPDHPHPDPGPQPDPNPGPNPDLDGSGGENPGKEMNYKLIRVEKRLMCEQADKGIYTLTMIVPSTASKSKLEFTLSGEQSDFDLPIMNAKVVSAGNTQVERIKDNVVFLKNLRKGNKIRLEVQVVFDRHCMMEVDYYESKK